VAQKAAQVASKNAGTSSAAPAAATASTVPSTGKVYTVGADGQAQKGLGVGDAVITNGGTYTITGVNADGTYQSKKTSNARTSNYGPSTTVDYTDEQYLQEQLAAAKNASYTPTDYSDYIKQLYSAKQENQLEALKSAYNTNVSDLDAEQDKLGTTYAASRQQTAADNAQEKQNFNETAAAYGLNSGTSGQAQLSHSNELQKNLSTLQAAQAAANTEIERQRTNLAKEYQSQILQAQSENDYQKAQALYEEATRQDEALQSQSQYNSTKAMQVYQALLDQYNTDRSYNYGVSQDKQSSALDAAKIQAELGDYSALGKIYGWTDAQVKTYNAAAAAQLAAKAAKSSGSGSSKSSGGSSGTSASSASLYSAMLSSGKPELYIAQHYKDYGIPYAQISNVYNGYLEWASSSGEAADSSTIGSTAKNMLANFMSHSMTTAQKTQAIQSACSSGTITSQEASYLMSAIGA